MTAKGEDRAGVLEAGREFPVGLNRDFVQTIAGIWGFASWISVGGYVRKLERLLFLGVWLWEFFRDWSFDVGYCKGSLRLVAERFG